MLIVRRLACKKCTTYLYSFNAKYLFILLESRTTDTAKLFFVLQRRVFVLVSGSIGSKTFLLDPYHSFQGCTFKKKRGWKINDLKGLGKNFKFKIQMQALLPLFILLT